jgi:hypothetical protein
LLSALGGSQFPPRVIVFKSHFLKCGCQSHVPRRGAVTFVYAASDEYRNSTVALTEGGLANRSQAKKKAG